MNGWLTVGNNNERTHQGNVLWADANGNVT
ncbi:Uncharacterised protein [Citrobacter freundii]|nr:Uncharacterised protein [Citrobacter freundii]SUX72498.1 Uncharacterised protein [Citrobacter freundii]